MGQTRKAEIRKAENRNLKFEWGPAEAETLIRLRWTSARHEGEMVGGAGLQQMLATGNPVCEVIIENVKADIVNCLDRSR